MCPPSVQKATIVEWDLLQTFDYRTLLCRCTQVFKGNVALWQGAVADNSLISLLECQMDPDY